MHSFTTAIEISSEVDFNSDLISFLDIRVLNVRVYALANFCALLYFSGTIKNASRSRMQCNETDNLRGNWHEKSKTIYVTIKDSISHILPHFIIKQYDVICMRVLHCWCNISDNRNIVDQ